MSNQTLQIIINQAAPIIITAVVAFLTAEIKKIGSSVVSYIGEKKEAVATKVGIDTYNSNLDKARKVWNIVDEYFRITPTVEKTIESAQDKFTEEIIKVIPGLTADDIEHLRQAVAGEVNKGKEALTAQIEKPAEVVPETTVKVISPTVKYYAEDGTELKPVDNSIEEDTTNVENSDPNTTEDTTSNISIETSVDETQTPQA